jgi:dATP pyrophosphohydrolase
MEKIFCVSAFIIKMEKEQARYLLIRRCGKLLHGNWQMVSGKVEEGETAWEAALREIKEETGLLPDSFYAADFVETFYQTEYDAVLSVPVFVAFVSSSQEIKLSPSEHDAYKWLSYEEALSYLEFSTQRDGIRHVNEQFIQRNPNKRLSISFMK